MNGKIAWIKTYKSKTNVRINVDKTTQKNYTRFRQELLNKFKVSKRGYGGYTEIIGRSMDINVFKGDAYIHLIIYAQKKTREEILRLLLKYFEFIEPRL